MIFFIVETFCFSKNKSSPNASFVRPTMITFSRARISLTSVPITGCVNLLNFLPIQLYLLNFKKPTRLKAIYKQIRLKGYELIEPEVAIYLRCVYTNQPKGEWLRIAVPFESMIDSDNVPHLPKLGSALGKLFLETYWSYPGAIFHPHNDFLVKKNDFK